MMVQAASFVYGEFDHLFGTGSQTDFPQHNAIPTANNKFHSATNLIEFDAEIA